MIRPALIAAALAFAAPSWAQTADDARIAEAAAARDAYWRAIDDENYAAAYAMLTPGMQNLDTPQEAQKFNSDQRRDMGVALERRVMRVTVYDNPASAPAPGVYIAFDVVGRFERADRNCGYIIMHQAAPGAPWLVTRNDQTFMSNADAAGPGQPDVAWAQLATSFCPGWQPSWVIQPPV